jgi:sugar-specific transcriptional regulator TrmB
MTPQETIARLQSQLDECRKERDEARERLEQAERTNQLHWLHEYEKVNEVFAKVMVTLGTTETALAASQSELYEATKRAHEHRLAFDWMVVELVPDASADDIEQLWQEAHAALKP